MRELYTHRHSLRQAALANHTLSSYSLLPFPASSSVQETSQRLHADLSRAQIDLDTLRAAKREDEEKIAALVHQVKRDKATIQALRAEADNASPNADVMVRGNVWGEGGLSWVGLDWGG